MPTADLIWMNGEFVSWEDAKVHVLTHSLHYGTGVFEGIRAYDTERGTAIFRHTEHLDRLAPLGRDVLHGHAVPLEKLREVTHELIVRNGFRSLLHPPARLPRRTGRWGSTRSTTRSKCTIAVWEWGAYLGEEGKRTESGPRSRPGSASRRSPCTRTPRRPGQYLNSVLAKIEATKAGYQEAILLDARGQRLRGHRREHLPRARRRDLHAAADRQHPRRHQPQVDDRRSRATWATR